MARDISRNCPGCNSTERQEVGTKNGFDINVCLACRSLYTSELPDADNEQDYDDYYSAANLSVPDFITERVEEIIRGFGKYRSTNRLLDIGFGSGIVLEVARKQGWEAYGQEVSAPAVAQAVEKGFEVFHGDLLSASYPDEFFDVITCSEILEHLPNPQEVLNKMAKTLRQGGLLLATTPSARGLSFRLLGTEWSVLSPPEHTQLYSRAGVSIMLKNAGFSKIRLQTFGLDPSEILLFFRRKAAGKSANHGKEFDPVESSYVLNRKLTSSPARKRIKGILNNTLDIFGMGDSLKIHAEK